MNDERTDATPPKTPDSGALAAAVRVISGVTLLSRFTGLARDIVTARLFGDDVLGSAFRAAYAFPNLFRRLFGEGALSAAFIPEYTTLRAKSPDAAAQLASLILWLLMLATGSITLLIEAALFVRLLFPHGEDLGLSIRLVMLMLPMMPLVCSTAMLAGVLQVHGKFGVPAAAPILLNVFQIAAGLAFFLGISADATIAAYSVGTAAVAASLAQVLWSLWALRGLVRWRRAFDDAKESGRVVLRRFVPVMLGLGTLQLNSTMDMLIAMWPTWVGPTMLGFAVTLDERSNAVLGYTQTIYQFPLGVFGIAVATAIFPLLARAAGDGDAFASMLRRGVRLSLFIGLPASAGMLLVREDVCAVIFGGGGKYSFSDEGVLRSAAVLGGFAPAIWAYSLNHVLTRAFYAKGDTHTPMRVAMAMVGFNLALNFALIWPLREAGLAWSTAISASVQTLVLIVLSRRRLGLVVFDRETRIGVARLLIACAVMIGLIVVAGLMLGQATTWSGHLVRLAALVCAGAGAYFAMAWVMRLPEPRWLMERGPRGGATIIE